MEFISDTIKEISGYPPNSFINNMVHSYTSIIHPDDRQRVLEEVDKSVNKKTTFILEYRIINANDEIIWISDKGLAVFDKKGDFLWIDGVMFDITRSKQAEEKLQKAKKEAIEANKAKSNFLANMSHEFRTPLNSLLGYTQILKWQKNITEAQRRHLDIMLSSGTHLLGLMNNILDQAKIETNKISFISSAFSLPNVIQHVINTSIIMTDEKELSFHHENLSSLPNSVIGDETRLKQILLNLLSNAIKFTKRGSGTLRSCYEEKDETLQCEVINTGIGIPSEKIDEIFEPFTQVGDGWKTTEGTGLGLTICHKLLDMRNGTLMVESEIKKGSTFKMRLKLPKCKDAKIFADGTEYKIIGYKGERKSILVIDDNLNNSSMLIDLLKPLGFKVDLADNGESGIQKALIISPDLVLLDFIMPVMDGLSTLDIIKSKAKLKSTTIIGVSASSSLDKDRNRLFIERCDDFITKPVRIEHLFEKIKSKLFIEWEIEEASIPVISLLESKEIKRPPKKILIAICRELELGDFASIEKIVGDLLAEDVAYTAFCRKLTHYIEKYDDEAIFAYINLKEES